jgi:hypothetical protein
MEVLCPPSQLDIARFVRAYPGAVDDGLVAELAGLTGGSRIDEDWRRCSTTPVEGDVLTRFSRVVCECFSNYRTLAPKTLTFCSRLERPNVLRYEPSATRPERFHEHSDAWDCASSTRQVSVIAYLNDVAQGGETVFTSFNYAHRCAKGTVLLFPSNFLYHHLARPPESSPKVVVVTWIHFGNGGEPTYLTTPLD